MTPKAESPQVREIAFASALSHRNNMVGLPQRLASTQLPIGKCFSLGQTAESFQVSHGRQAIETALRTDAGVALQDAPAQVAGIGAYPPLLYTPLRAKSKPSGRNLQIAPAAQRSPVFAFSQIRTSRTSARHGSFSAHTI